MENEGGGGGGGGLCFLFRFCFSRRKVEEGSARSVGGPLIAPASKLRRPVCAHLHRSLVSSAQTSARADAH